MGADEREVEPLHAVGVHDGFLFVPFGDDFVHAVRLVGDFACIENGFELGQQFTEVELLFGLFGSRLFCSDTFGVRFFEELRVACENFVEGRLLGAHAQGLRFFHQGIELCLYRERVFFGGEVVRLLDKGMPLSGEERGGLLAVVFGFTPCTELFVRNLLYGVVFGLFGDFRQRRFGFDAFDSHLRDIFLRILGGGQNQNV